MSLTEDELRAIDYYANSEVITVDGVEVRVFIPPLGTVQSDGSTLRDLKALLREFEEQREASRK